MPEQQTFKSSYKHFRMQISCRLCNDWCIFSRFLGSKNKRDVFCYLISPDYFSEVFFRLATFRAHLISYLTSLHHYCVLKLKFSNELCLFYYSKNNGRQIIRIRIVIFTEILKSFKGEQKNVLALYIQQQFKQFLQSCVVLEISHVQR